MTAQLIDGNALSRTLRADVAARAAALKARGVVPGLAVVLVGDNPASQVYVRNKVKACEDNGLHSVLERHPADLSEADLARARRGAQRRPGDPRHPGAAAAARRTSTRSKVIEAIAPAKDVDGFHVASAGALHDRRARLLALHAATAA